jgi:hypothetical protein
MYDSRIGGVSRKQELREQIAKTSELLNSLIEFNETKVGKAINEELTSEYQREFIEATTTKDAHEAKAHLDRMKGIGYAMGVVNSLIVRIDDDLENAKNEMMLEEAGE